MSERLRPRRIWAMPVVVTVTSVLAIFVGLLADGAVDTIACVGVGVPIVLIAWHLARPVRRVPKR